MCHMQTGDGWLGKIPVDPGHVTHKLLSRRKMDTYRCFQGIILHFPFDGLVGPGAEGTDKCK
jgi:hypothetical protein